MEEAKVIFCLDGNNLLVIQCSKENKMRDICEKYATKINKNLNSLTFLYEGCHVNLELSFKDQATHFNINNNEMKILVYENKNYNIIYTKSREIIKINKEKIEDIKSFNNEIKDNINEMNLQIENEIKTSSNISMNIQLKNSIKLSQINQEVDKNNKNLKCQINDNNTINDKTINNNNNFDKKLILDNESNIEKNEELLININNIEENNENHNKNKLLQNIKSIIIFKKFFSFLGEKTKLKVIKYNKHFQKKINIKLINYIFLSEKYIIYEDNENGKEYNGYDDHLIFEGEFLNGKRNVKGKKYNLDGEIEFEGEYINGKRWDGKIYDRMINTEYELKKGKGFIKDFDHKGKLIIKDFDHKGKLIFEGEYLNGERNGKGKEYDENRRIIFEGEYLNGERNGKGKEYYNGQLIFEGEYLNGERNGKGEEYDWNDKLKFAGEYKHGNRWNGKIYDNLNNAEYELKEGKGFIKDFD